MIIGEHNRQSGFADQCLQNQEADDMRSATAEVLEVLSTPIAVTLEFGLDYIATDELMEVTPESIRLRKENLNIKG